MNKLITGLLIVGGAIGRDYLHPPKITYRGFRRIALSGMAFV